MQEILIVDDDALLRRSLTFQLEKSDYAVQAVGTGAEALAVLKTRSPHLLLLDIGLPDTDGLTLLQQIRQHHNTPIIFITARLAELDEVLGLTLGADDYITKPFTTGRLLARIASVLRRVQLVSSDNNTLTVGDLRLNPDTHVVTRYGEPLDLPPRVFDLLQVFMQNAGQILTTEALFKQVWGEDFEGDPQVVYVHIRWLREKIEATPNRPQRLLTIRGVGYKLLP